MIKTEKNVTTVGIEVKDTGEKDEVSVVVVGSADRIMVATARLMADVVSAISKDADINENACLGYLCGMAAKVMGERYEDEKEANHG